MTVSDLVELNLKHYVNQDQVILLLTLVPILLVLFGSWYKHDVFFGTTEEKTELLLKEILQEIKVLNHTNGSTESTQLNSVNTKPKGIVILNALFISCDNFFCFQIIYNVRNRYIFL